MYTLINVINVILKRRKSNNIDEKSFNLTKTKRILKIYT